MGVVRLGEGRWELDDLVKRVEAGETIEIWREGRLVAKIIPVEPHQAEPVAASGV